MTNETKTGMIDTGDEVLHRPSGETYVVAVVEGDQIIPCGWPLSYAKVSDCVLVKSATDEERIALLSRMAEMQDASDPRYRHAKSRLAALGSQPRPAYALGDAPTEMTDPRTKFAAQANQLRLPAEAARGSRRVIHNADHLQHEIDNASVPPEQRSDWPLPSFDADDWAKAFHAQHASVDLDDARAWFAAALMRGYDEARSRAQQISGRDIGPAADDKAGA